MRSQAPLDCITPECVASKRLTVQPGDITLNSLQYGAFAGSACCPTTPGCGTSCNRRTTCTLLWSEARGAMRLA